MDKYFNVNIEFDRQKVDNIVVSTIRNRGKGYVCSIESNNLTIANIDPEFNKVVNESLVNICDGSVLARIIGFVHKKSYRSYIGADLFLSFIEKRAFKQYFLGNTQEVLDGLKKNLSIKDPNIQNMRFVPLPFKRVEEFDYEAIAADINKYQPDIIWVSLGAPKQEIFMHRLLPHLEKGIMFGFGAIFNFNAGTGSVKRAPQWMRKWKVEWLYRAFEEPKKNIPRYYRFICRLPGLISQEYRQVRKQRQREQR
ncbi:MAG: WecB/TagA/CpsF family glycosyltransferase [Gammaproteobacteria bacterium]